MDKYEIGNIAKEINDAHNVFCGATVQHYASLEIQLINGLKLLVCGSDVKRQNLFYSNILERKSVETLRNWLTKCLKEFNKPLQLKYLDKEFTNDIKAICKYRNDLMHTWYAVSQNILKEFKKNKTFIVKTPIGTPYGKDITFTIKKQQTFENRVNRSKKKLEALNKELLVLNSK